MRWIFKTYVHWAVGRHFKAVDFNRLDVDDHRSVLLVANHFSIWDALLLYIITPKAFGKKFHVMILEETARREPMLKYGGAFAVRKEGKSILESIDHAARLLNDPQNLVLIFPQGKLYSNFVDELHFEKGIMRVMEEAAGRFQLIYAATFIENFRSKKPSANIYLHKVINCKFDSITTFTADYRQHYHESKLQQTQIVL